MRTSYSGWSPGPNVWERGGKLCPVEPHVKGGNDDECDADEERPEGDSAAR